MTEQRRLTSDEFRNVIGSFASGVTVVTTRDGETAFGSTASAVSSLSLEPPMLLVCLNRTSSTREAITRAGRFAVNILGEDHADLADRFATKHPEKFVGVATRDGLGAVPLLGDALATLECMVTEEVAAATHSVFLGEVERASGGVGAPLAYFRGQFGRLELDPDTTAVRALRTLVLNRDVPIGERLDIDDLARRLDAPRGTIYHALSRLADEAVVEPSGVGGFVAPPMTLERVEDAIKARYAILLGVAAMTVESASDEEVTEQRRLMEAMEPGRVTRDPAAWVRGREAFARHHIGMTRSAELGEAFHRVNIPGLIALLQGSEEAEDAAHAPDRVHPLYRQIVEGYETRDLNAVLAAIRVLLDLRLSSTRALFTGRAEI